MRLNDLAVRIASACLVLAGAASASAQEATQPEAAAPDSACELHVWPTTRAATAYNLMLNPALQRGVVDDSILLQALPPEAQVAALERLDLPRLLDLPGVRVIRESQPIQDRDARRQESRFTASTASCYAELIVRQIGYNTDPFWGRKFDALLIYRRFAPGSPTAEIIQGRSGVKLRIFPARREDQREAAREELSTGFGTVFEKFVQDRLNRDRSR